MAKLGVLWSPPFCLSASNEIYELVSHRAVLVQKWGQEPILCHYSYFSIKYQYIVYKFTLHLLTINCRLAVFMVMLSFDDSYVQCLFCAFSTLLKVCIMSVSPFLDNSAEPIIFVPALANFYCLSLPHIYAAKSFLYQILETSH